MASTDLIVPGDDSPYAVLRMQGNELTELIETNLAPGETIGIGDLPRIKIPTGGGTTWSVPDPLAGTERDEKEIVGVLIHISNRRVYWEKSFEETGGGEPPDCSSDDMILGVGNPGGACMECPLNEFPEKDARGYTPSKPCKEMRQLFLIPHGQLLPTVLNVTPGSLKNFATFRKGLLSAGLKVTDIEVGLSLEKSSGDVRVIHSKVKFRKAGDLDPEARERFSAYADLLRPYLSRVRVERDDIDGTASEEAAAA